MEAPQSVTDSAIAQAHPSLQPRGYGPLIDEGVPHELDIHIGVIKILFIMCASTRDYFEFQMDASGLTMMF